MDEYQLYIKQLSDHKAKHVSESVLHRGAGSMIHLCEVIKVSEEHEVTEDIKCIWLLHHLYFDLLSLSHNLHCIGKIV